MDFNIPDLSGFSARLDESSKAMSAPYKALKQLTLDADDIRKSNAAIREHSEKIAALGNDVEKIRQNAVEIERHTSEIAQQITDLCARMDDIKQELAKERERAEAAEKKAHQLAFAAGTISLLIGLWFPELKDLLYSFGSWLAS